MHSFHQSRGRILFEVFCAMTMAASFAVAWTQTGASALMAAAAVAVLYSVVRTFDLRQRSPAVAAVVPVASTVMDERCDLLGEVAAIEDLPVVEQEKAAAKPKRRSRKKQPASETAADVEIAAPQVLEFQAETPEAVEVGREDPEIVEFEDEHHPAPVPLFEPEPFVRQQRTVFGRKAG